LIPLRNDDRQEHGAEIGLHAAINYQLGAAPTEQLTCVNRYDKKTDFTLIGLSRYRLSSPLLYIVIDFALNFYYSELLRFVLSGPINPFSTRDSRQAVQGTRIASQNT